MLHVESSFREREDFSSGLVFTLFPTSRRRLAMQGLDE